MHRPTSNYDQTAAALKELQRIPGIGPGLARDLVELNICRRNPGRLHEQFIALRGVHQDRCVLHTFRCAAHFATMPRPGMEKLEWWNRQDAGLATSPRRRR